MEAHVIRPVGVEMEGEKAVMDSHIGSRVDNPGLGRLGEPQRPYSRADHIGPMQLAVMALPAVHSAGRFGLIGHCRR